MWYINNISKECFFSFSQETNNYFPLHNNNFIGTRSRGNECKKSKSEAQERESIIIFNSILDLIKMSDKPFGYTSRASASKAMAEMNDGSTVNRRRSSGMRRGSLGERSFRRRRSRREALPENPLGMDPLTLQALQTPPSRRVWKDTNMLQNWMSTHSSLTIDTDSLYDLCAEMVYQRYIARDVIIRQGEVGDSFYIILNGVVAVSVNGKVVCELTSGQSFGEIALLKKGSKRNATVYVPRHCPEAEFAQISATPYHEFIAQQHVREHKLKVQFLSNDGNVLIDRWSAQHIDDLAHRLQTQKFKYGECPVQIIKAGSPAEWFYFVSRGQVVIKRRFAFITVGKDGQTCSTEHVATLIETAPTFVGEHAILKGRSAHHVDVECRPDPRSAPAPRADFFTESIKRRRSSLGSERVDDAAIVMKLAKEDFHRLLTSSSESYMKLVALSMKRQKKLEKHARDAQQKFPGSTLVEVSKDGLVIQNKDAKESLENAGIDVSDDASSLDSFNPGDPNFSIDTFRAALNRRRSVGPHYYPQWSSKCIRGSGRRSSSRLSSGSANRFCYESTFGLHLPTPPVTRPESYTFAPGKGPRGRKVSAVCRRQDLDELAGVHAEAMEAAALSRAKRENRKLQSKVTESFFIVADALF